MDGTMDDPMTIRDEPGFLARKRDKRREILETAMGIFAARGFDGATLEAVADGLGYTKPAIYYYFRNKEDLFSAIVIESLREASARILEIRAETAGPREQLRHLIRYYVDEHFTRRGFFAIYHQLHSFRDKVLKGPELEEFERLSASIPRAIMGMIGDGIESGVFRRKEPAVLGGVIFGMLTGVLMNLDMPVLARADREELKNTVCEIVIKGIEP